MTKSRTFSRAKKSCQNRKRTNTNTCPQCSWTVKIHHSQLRIHKTMGLAPLFLATPTHSHSAQTLPQLKPSHSLTLSRTNKWSRLPGTRFLNPKCWRLKLPGRRITNPNFRSSPRNPRIIIAPALRIWPLNNRRAAQNPTGIPLANRVRKKLNNGGSKTTLTTTSWK